MRDYVFISIWAITRNTLVSMHGGADVGGSQPNDFVCGYLWRRFMYSVRDSVILYFRIGTTEVFNLVSTLFAGRSAVDIRAAIGNFNH